MRLTIALAVSFALFLGGCGDKDKIAELENQVRTLSQANADLEKKIRSRYSAATIATAVVGCVNRSGDPKFCSCMIDELQNNIPEQQFLAADVTIATGGSINETFAQASAKAATVCRR